MSQWFIVVALAYAVLPWTVIGLLAWYILHKFGPEGLKPLAELVRAFRRRGQDP